MQPLIKTAEDDDDKSFWSRHKKKIIGGTLGAGALGLGAYAAHKKGLIGGGKSPQPSGSGSSSGKQSQPSRSSGGSSSGKQSQPSSSGSSSDTELMGDDMPSSDEIAEKIDRETGVADISSKSDKSDYEGPSLGSGRDIPKKKMDLFGDSYEGDKSQRKKDQKVMYRASKSDKWVPGPSPRDENKGWHPPS